MEIAINVFPTEIAFQHELESRKEGTQKKNTLKIHTVIKFYIWFIHSNFQSEIPINSIELFLKNFLFGKYLLDKNPHFLTV